MNDRIRIVAMLAIFLAPYSLVAAAAPMPELAPPPKEVERHVQFATTDTGYTVTLSRKASEKLRDALAAVGDGKPVTDLAKRAVKELDDPEADKKIDKIAWIVNKQGPLLKKALDAKMGPGGAVIKVYGIERKVIPEPPPLIKAVGAAFLPPDVKDKIDTGMKVINTSVLFWKVEPRK